MPIYLEMAMKEIWHQNGGIQGVSTHVAAKKNTKIELNAVMGTCYICKEKGHRALRRPIKEHKGNSKSNNADNHCRKAGHLKVDFWELLENAAKKPSSYEGKNDHANAQVDNSRSDKIVYVLCTIEAEVRKRL